MFLKLVLVTLFSKSQFLQFFSFISFQLKTILTNFSIYFYFEKFEWKTLVTLYFTILPFKHDLRLNLKKTKTLQFAKIPGLKRRINRKFFFKTKKFFHKKLFTFIQLRKNFFYTKIAYQTRYFLSQFFFHSFFSKLKKTWSFLLGNIFPYLTWSLATVSRLTLSFKKINLKSNFSKFERATKLTKKSSTFFLKKIFIKNFNYFNRQRLKYSKLAFRLKSFYSSTSPYVKLHFSLKTKPYLFLNSPRFSIYERRMAKYYWFIFNYKNYQEYVSMLFFRKKLKKCISFKNKFRKNFKFSKKKLLLLKFTVVNVNPPLSLKTKKSLTRTQVPAFKNVKTIKALTIFSTAKRLTQKMYYNFFANKLFAYLFFFISKNNKAWDSQNSLVLAHDQFNCDFTIKIKALTTSSKNYRRKKGKFFFHKNLQFTKHFKPFKCFKILKDRKNVKRRLYALRLFFTRFLQKRKFLKGLIRYKLKNVFYAEYAQILDKFNATNTLRENRRTFVMSHPSRYNIKRNVMLSRIKLSLFFFFYRKCCNFKHQTNLKASKCFISKILKPVSKNFLKLKRHYVDQRAVFRFRSSFFIRNLRNSNIKKRLNPVTFFTRTKTQFLSSHNGFLYLSSFQSPLWYKNMIPEVKKLMFSFATRYETHRYIIKNYYKTEIFEFYNNSFIENRSLFTHTLNDKWHLSSLNNLFTVNFSFIKKTFRNLKASNKTSFEIQRTPDFHIKRVKFKPGYRRIWKEARAVAQMTLNTRFRYQKKFTRYLSKFRKYAHLKLLVCFEMSLVNILRQSTFLYYDNIVRNFLSNKLIFVNGFNCVNPNFQIFVNDFIQFLVSFAYYISYKFIINYFLKRKIKIRIRLRKKNNKASLGFEKKKSSTLPHWLLFEKNLENDVSKFFEIDFFSLSIFIVYEPFLVENLNHHEICNIKYGVINMYNWKYIT